MTAMRFTGQTGFYSGKVRDVYSIADKWLLMIASNRISAFDVILPRLIPYKGQVLNQIAAYMLRATEDICPNWLLSTPTPSSSFGKKCTPFKVEMVIRGNLTGHALRIYATGKRDICGEKMPDGMKENNFFPSPIITPTTKASIGHDEDTSRQAIIDQGIVSEADYSQLEEYTRALFERGKQLAADRGLILADTKYEFGKIDNTIYLMDEIHTPDSSRYFYADGFEQKLASGEKQQQLSKEFVREWLIQNNFMGKEGQSVPAMSDEWVDTISKRYIELYEKVIGQMFVPVELNDNEMMKKINLELQKITF